MFIHRTVIVMAVFLFTLYLFIRCVNKDTLMYVFFEWQSMSGDIICVYLGRLVFAIK